MPSAFEHGPTLTVVASPTANAGVIWSAANNLGQSTVLLGTGTLGISGDTDIITLTANTVTVAGTVAATTLTGNGAGITALAAGNIATGTVPTARLGSGTADNSVFLRGDGTWNAAGGGLDSNADAIIHDGYGIVIGHTGVLAAANHPANTVGEFTMIGAAGGDTGIHVIRHAADAGGGAVRFAKSRNATVGSHTIVSSGDTLGEISWFGDNGTQLESFAATIIVKVDGTPGASSMPGRMEFRTTASGAIGATTRMQINQNGNIGLGTTLPSSRLHVESGNANALIVESNGDNYYTFHMRNLAHTTSTHAKLIMHCYQDFVMINNARYDSQGTGAYINLNCNAAVGIGTNSPSSSYKLDVNGSVHGSSHPTSSDERLKTNITELTGVLPKLANIRAVTFNWDTTNVSEERAKAYGTDVEIGMIAQDIEAEFPEIITKWIDGEEGHAVDNEFRAVEYGRFTSILLAAIKELKAEIDELKGL